MVDRDPVELKWRKEFDAMGEAGVREEFFKGTFQASQRKEASAFRWLGERRKEQQRIRTGRNRRIGLVTAFILLCLVILAAMLWFMVLENFLDKAGSALRFIWKAIAGTLGKAP